MLNAFFLDTSTHVGCVCKCPKLQVWNSDLGTLLHTVKDAHVSVFVPHPYDAKSLATVGGDGELRMWSVQLTGMVNIRTFKNVFDAGPECAHHRHGMSVPLLCGVFSPDGFSIAVTDMVGRWMLYGTGQRPDETSAGKRVPLEQYFAPDYMLPQPHMSVLVAADGNVPLQQHFEAVTTATEPQTTMIVDFDDNVYPKHLHPTTVCSFSSLEFFIVLLHSTAAGYRLLFSLDASSKTYSNLDHATNRWS
ncbi:unnamed protein product [Ectocarpus sp. 6 AP-2014]